MSQCFAASWGGMAAHEVRCNADIIDVVTGNLKAIVKV
jgi:hypothetical protein